MRLVAATLDPSKLDPDNTWYLATSLPMSEASTEQVYEIYRLRDWIEHYYKPAKHELGWADYQMRPERAIVRHWHLVMLAFTLQPADGLAPGSPSFDHSCRSADCRRSGRKKNREGKSHVETAAAQRASSEAKYC